MKVNLYRYFRLLCPFCCMDITQDIVERKRFGDDYEADLSLQTNARILALSADSA